MIMIPCYFNLFHQDRGTVVAIKAFHDHVALGYKQDDLRELELLRQLEHPNIIRLLAIQKEVSFVEFIALLAQFVVEQVFFGSAYFSEFCFK